MVAEQVFVVLAGGLFLGAGVLARRFRRATATYRASPADWLVASGALFLALALALLTHRSGHVPVFGLFGTMVSYVLCVACLYLLMARRFHLHGLPAYLSPYLVLLLACAAFGRTLPAPPPAALRDTWLGLHVVAAFLGYALFTLAGLLATAYLVQDYRLKRKQLGLARPLLPSLEKLDHLMDRHTRYAFLAFSTAIAFGAVLIQRRGGGHSQLLDPKVAVTVLTWLVYAILIHLRVSADRHGRKVALATLAALVCVLFAFVGIHLAVDSWHNFVLLR